MTVTLKTNPTVSSSEYSPEFLQGMLTRSEMSYFKYGLVSDAYPLHVDALDSCRDRIYKYRETGNTEYLMDAANFLMFEFMFPYREDAHFTPTDSSESPGRAVTHGDRHDSNRELVGANG